MRLVFVFPIFVYQNTLSPLIGRNCRFTPTCSAYVFAAIIRHGVLRGTALAMARIVRCHPYNPGGYDPVPKED
ncbi:MAG: membrane protein insertion efficiency factor YidD [Candidatus Brocadiia bacterium]